MSRFIVAYEGRDTADGRHIEVGALTPRLDRIPILEEFDQNVHCGWATEFQRFLNLDTGWTQISFEMAFVGKYEDMVRMAKLTPTCTMVNVVGRTPYEEPDQAKAVSQGKTLVISHADISSVNFSLGPNAWGEYPE